MKFSIAKIEVKFENGWLDIGRVHLTINNPFTFDFSVEDGYRNRKIIFDLNEVFCFIWNHPFHSTYDKKFPPMFYGYLIGPLEIRIWGKE